MRISTNQFHNQGVSSITNHQVDLLKIQETLSTGKKVNSPSDDPVAMNQIHSLNKAINTIDQYARNGETAKAQLTLEETGINNTVDALQRARELAIQMSNDTYNEGDLKAAGAEINQLISQVRNSMNYVNSEGEALFAGNNILDVPFISDEDGYDSQHPVVGNMEGFYSYIGSEQAAADYDPLANYGARYVQVSFDMDNTLSAGDDQDASRVRITDTGSKVFGPGSDPGYFKSLAALDIGYDPTDPAYVPDTDDSPDQNVLNVLVLMEKYFSAGEQPPDVVGEDLDTAIDNLSNVRAEIGGRQQKIESQYDAGQVYQIALKERRMQLEETDTVQAITDFTLKQNALEMAQQIFSKVNGMSLFNYFR